MEFQEVVDSLQSELELVETRLRQAADVEYPLVGDFLSAIVASGGKRLRPILLLLAAKSYDYNVPVLVPAAAGIELLHTASLVHDDTIDHALFRRGQPTLNSAFSSEAVILLGDFLFAQSAMLATETMNPRVVRVFATTLGEITDGVLREIFSGHRTDQTKQDYEMRIYGKTASLFAGAAEMGALIGGAPEESVSAIRSFGSDFGMAFQIVDDVLDFRSTADQTGKPVGADLRQGTVTLPTMYFLEDAPNGPTATLVQRIVDGEAVPEDEVQEITDLISRSGAIDQAMEVASNYIASARDHLNVIEDSTVHCQLEAMTDLALNRIS
ncbi:MAG: polyprenyl synthetase family protein [Thermomicrobiales bacterium]